MKIKIFDLPTLENMGYKADNIYVNERGNPVMFLTDLGREYTLRDNHYTDRWRVTEKGYGIPKDCCYIMEEE